MTEREGALRRYPAVSHDAHSGRHYQRHKALHHIEQINLVAKAYLAEEHTQRHQIRTPDSKFQESENRQAYFQISHQCIFVRLVFRERGKTGNFPDYFQEDMLVVMAKLRKKFCAAAKIPDNFSI